ncbi:hypothetical protein [Sphingomonas sp. GM_Shp_1]|uniref:hypothetical protein n=1 Tax=Sphingomonas sp. GM_Shp_1 TaxID=2937381 RepID=UPI00226B4587|nr:hypothetical protein [Sphingomonas sp. GM_Shp_1]
MRKITTIASLTAIASLSACATRTNWNPGIATPTATSLYYQRDQNRVDPIGTAALLAAGMGLQAAGRQPGTSRPGSAPGADPATPVRAVETPSAPRAEIDDEAAVRACILAAEGEAKRSHAHALLDQVASVDPLGDGLLVRGTLRLREQANAVEGVRPFRCRVDSQAVRMIAIDPVESIAAR